MSSADMRRRYAVCGNGNHLARAFAFMGDRPFTVSNASGLEGYTCTCLKRARWLLREHRP